MPTIQTVVRGTGNLETSRVVPDIADGIFLLEPNANPFTLISRKVGKMTSGSIKHSWYADELNPDTVTLSSTEDSSHTTLVLKTGHGERVAVGDILIVHDSLESMLVDSISTDTITVRRDWGQNETGNDGWAAYATQIATNDTFIIAGNAMTEGSTAPTLRATLEVLRNNYCQGFRAPFAITEETMNSFLYGEQALPYQTRKNGIELGRKIEWANLFGKPYIGERIAEQSTASANDPATCGGIVHYIRENAPSANKLSQTELTKAEFLLWIRDCFAFGETRNRFLFVSPLVASAIESWALADLQTRTTDNQYGINASTWVSPHGTLSIIIHKMLGARASGQGNWALMLDMGQIKQVVMNKMDMRLVKNIQANDAMIRKDELRMTQCIEIKGSAGNHGYIRDVTSFAA